MSDPTDIQKYAAESVDEYPEITVEWRRMRLRAFIEQAYRFGLFDGNHLLAGFMNKKPHSAACAVWTGQDCDCPAEAKP